jgi:hypothetical protein
MIHVKLKNSRFRFLPGLQTVGVLPTWFPLRVSIHCGFLVLVQICHFDFGPNPEASFGSFQLLQW